MKDLVLVNRHFHDLNPLIVGEEHCEPGHHYGPSVRNYTLIHFVVTGEGTFTRGGVTYHLGAGEAFIIRPNEVTTYVADEKNPWYYQWVGFDGALTANFEGLPPVVHYSQNWVEKMLEAYENDGMYEYHIAALLFEMCTEFFADQKPQNHYVRRVKNYINTLYMQHIRVEEIADKMNLDRRYLSRLFKEKTGLSVQEYLIAVRMNEAKKHLESGASVARAAQLAGYEDVCNFSKMFKRTFGVSPGNWKKRIP